MKGSRRIKILYAGGTIGMIREAGAYRPGDALPVYLMQQIRQHPVLSQHEWQIEALSPLLDSANAGPQDWHEMARRLWLSDAKPETRVDAAVVLHGTDTMDYACAFLSFFMQGWGRPVIFTGSQQPLGVVQGDAQSNLMQALLCALQAPSQTLLCMGGRVQLASRVAKLGVDAVQGFQSPHWHDIASVHEDRFTWSDALVGQGITGKATVGKGDNDPAHQAADSGLELLTAWTGVPTPSVGVLRLYPGMPPALPAWLGEQHPQGLVLQTYGSGTGPSASSGFRDALVGLHKQGVPMVAVSQCPWAEADLATYEAGRLLAQAGVMPGGDMTTAAAYAKLHYLAALRRLNTRWQRCSHQALQAWISRPLVNEAGAGTVSEV